MLQANLKDSFKAQREVVEIASNPPLEDVKVGAEAQLFLQPKVTEAYEDGRPLLKIRCHEEVGVWGGWHSRWLNVGGKRQKFEWEFLSASWRFLVGRDHDVSLLLRAEWEQDGGKPGDAPQPHWHLHGELQFTRNLEQVFAQLRRLHLAMGGWESMISLPWQRKASRFESVHDWTISVFLLARDELCKHLRFRDPSKENF
jgi:hypothetical protein